MFFSFATFTHFLISLSTIINNTVGGPPAASTPSLAKASLARGNFRSDQFLVEKGHDRLRRARRSKQSEPGGRLVTRYARFGHGPRVREIAPTLRLPAARSFTVPARMNGSAAGPSMMFWMRPPIGSVGAAGGGYGMLSVLTPAIDWNSSLAR